YWDMRYPEPNPVNGFVTGSGTVPGPLAVPGAYEARLTAGGQTYTARFAIRLDPRVPVTQEDLEAQFALLVRLRDRLSETHEAVNTLQSIRRQVEEWERRAEGHVRHDEVAAAGAALRERLSGIEEELIQPKVMEDDDTLRYP